jgi:AraC family transcriptional regulator, regulatory protein of adaptative response / methylated-DNA-[protein]-cysteine methyltransferase
MSNTQLILKSSWLSTPLGPMLAIADEHALYLLEFAERRNLERELKQLPIKSGATIIPGRTQQIDYIEQELALYFAGTLKEFKTPVHLGGSPFQHTVWNTLMTIPYGHTVSYAQEAITMGKPSASRAVANANGANQLAIIIPCHRIINSNGKLGGYGGGIARKQWLLNHEKKNIL